MATALEILGAIRDNATALYIERVPEATRENLPQVGKAITSIDSLKNEFISALMNKVAFSNIMHKLYKNPLAILKKAGVPYGKYNEEIFVNPATDAGYSNDGNLLLKTTKPDGKTAYYGLNRMSCYPVTVTMPQLRRAFTGEQQFMEFYNSLVTTLFSGDNIDEFQLIKNLIGKTIDEGGVLVVESDLAPLAGGVQVGAKELSKAISNMSKAFTFPSQKFAGYNLVNADKITAGEKPCITFCDVSKQCLIIRADAQTEIDYEVLASMFNIELGRLQAMTILVDDIPSTKYDVYAMLCDVDAIQVRDVLNEMKMQDNGATLSYNFWLHHHQFLYLSMFANCVAFGKTKSQS